jgi:hypothetical protein
VKQVKATNKSKVYTENIVSFQSTGPTNISSVNNLPSLELYVTKRDREGDAQIIGLGKSSKMNHVKHT